MLMTSFIKSNQDQFQVLKIVQYLFEFTNKMDICYSGRL